MSEGADRRESGSGDAEVRRGGESGPGDAEVSRRGESGPGDAEVSRRGESGPDDAEVSRGGSQGAWLRVAHSVACTEAEGPFRRHALWVQGCTLACPGCCNPELFPATGGERRGVGELVAELRASRALHAVEGLTVLGGEPSEQLAGVTALCAAARGLGLGVIVYSGRTLAELLALPGGRALLATVDTLIDGRFDASRREPVEGRRHIGSSNQRQIHRTSRYADPALWRGPSGVELQLTPDGGLSLHGAPALARRLGRALSRAPGER